METYYMVLCCLLLTTTSRLSLADVLSEYDNDSPALDAQGSSCNCENGRCFTDKEGNMKCACKPGFALQGEFTCKPCDCGSLGKCIFVLKPTGNNQFQHQKKCVCDKGCAEKEGVCVACDCGENSACDFDYGDRRCYCIEGYSEKNGVCTRCDCGFNGKCSYQNDNKRCECDEGFLVLNGICEECDCGFYGSCSFVNGQKSCNCQQKFSVSNGKCESCDCGPNSDSCGFVNGVKQCTCKDKYANWSGRCEECNCGAYSRGCNFNNNQKTCNCLEGYVQKGESCQLACSTRKPCQNGGYCKNGFCFCQKGTRGEFCETIDDCTNLCPNTNDIKCHYDPTSQKAYCVCQNPNLRYDPNRKQCRVGCSVQQPCQNGGNCKDGFCICQRGTRGEFCEVVDGCNNLCPNQPDIRCTYDVPSQRAYCRCLNGNLRYDPNTRQCRGNCVSNQQCLNGVCRNGMCVCLPGTYGDRCEIVDCVSNAIRCIDQVFLLWRGRDTLFILWKGIMFKYVRQNVILPYVSDCQYGTAVKCYHPYDYLWCHGGATVYIPTPQNQVLRYVRVNAAGLTCARRNVQRNEPLPQIENKSEFKQIGDRFYVSDA